MLNELAQELAKLYGDADSAKRLVAEAGIDPALIEFTGNAADMWHRIVQSADNQGLLAKLLSIAVREFGTNAKLNRIYGTFLYPQGKAMVFSSRGTETPNQQADLTNLTRSVNRLTEIIQGTDWGAEGLQASTRRIEADCKSISTKVEELKEDVGTLKRNQSFNRKILFLLAFAVFVLGIIQVVAMSGIWRGFGP